MHLSSSTSLDLSQGAVQGSSEKQNRASPNSKCSSLPALYLLISHLPKQVTCPLQLEQVWRNRQTLPPDGRGKLCGHYLQLTIIPFLIFSFLHCNLFPIFKVNSKRALWLVILTSCLFYTLQIYSPMFHLSLVVSFIVLKLIWLKKFSHSKVK